MQIPRKLVRRGGEGAIPASQWGELLTAVFREMGQRIDFAKGDFRTTTVGDRLAVALRKDEGGGAATDLPTGTADYEVMRWDVATGKWVVDWVRAHG